MNCIVSGASSGIGKEICKYLLSKGHKVLALARREEMLKELEGEEGYSYLAIDLSSSSSTLNDAIKALGQVDILINNAGALINTPFKDSSPADFEQQYRSNVITAVNLVQAADPYLKQGSHIVNISSMGGFQGSSKYPGLAAYSTAKGALSILSECLAEEYKERGVSVNALALGAVQTDMLAAAFPGFDAGTKPAEMAKFIADFAIGSGSLMSGQVIPVAKGNP
jgi:NAD(P)-dependent dehydrogenase (short-subunit alcohol dehydrogenase family)